MGIRQVDSSGTDFDLFGCRREPGDEGDAGGDVLGLVGDVFADIAFAKAQFVGEQEGFPVLSEGLPPILLERMDRHREEPELHGLLLPTGRLFDCRERCVVSRFMTSPKVERIAESTSLTFKKCRRLIPSKHKNRAGEGSPE